MNKATLRPGRGPVPPLSFYVIALVALLHLPDRQIWVQPVEFIWLQVLQQEAVASRVFDVRPQPTTDQDRTDDGLKDAESAFVFRNIMNIQ